MGFRAHANASSEGFWKTFREALDKPGVVAKEEGMPGGAQGSAKVVEADYEVPYLAHATMEPMNCTAQVRPERVDVGRHAESEGALAAAAEITGWHQRMSTSTTASWAVASAGVATTTSAGCDRGQSAGRPTGATDLDPREDIRHDFYRPMAAIRFRAALDANGVPTAYFNRSVTHSILSGIRPDDVKDGIDRPGRGLGQYPVWLRPVPHRAPDPKHHVPVWFWRSVGASQNAFAVECFIDELATPAARIRSSCGASC